MTTPLYRFRFSRGPAGLNRDHAKVNVEVVASTETEARQKATRMSSGGDWLFWLIEALEIQP